MIGADRREKEKNETAKWRRETSNPSSYETSNVLQPRLRLAALDDPIILTVVNGWRCLDISRMETGCIVGPIKTRGSAVAASRPRVCPASFIQWVVKRRFVLRFWLHL